LAVNFKLKDYQEIVGREALNELTFLGEKLGKRRLLHINSTKQGGGVAEILNRLIPLLNELGVKARWEVMEGRPEFFEVTKAFHNALQGQELSLSQELLDTYLITNHENARRIKLEADLVVIHDPQPAAMVRHRNKGQKWVWRCHIDLSHPHPKLWNYLGAYVSKYDASVFHMAKFTQKLTIPQFLITPSIDPLSDKNREMSETEIETLCDKLGIMRDKPLIVQISRFDLHKDPLGVIKSFLLVRRHIDCRLVLAGGGAGDDPEGARVLTQVREAAEGNPDIYILELPAGSDLEINAIQRAASVIVQKSLREGFGLTITEGMWKGKPVIGGASGGIALQIENHFNGYLVHSLEGAAYRLRYVLSRPELMRRLGQNGREFVRRNFLITRSVRDHLLLALALDRPAEATIMI
jgi:trehalose synthase